MSRGCRAVGSWADLLRDRVNLWDFSRVQECVRGSTIRSTDIKSENELSRGAVIGCADHEGLGKVK